MSAFRRTPFESEDEAVKAFLARDVMTKEQFYLLSEERRGTAWTVSKLMSVVTINKCKTKLAGIIADGGTVEMFTEWLEAEAMVWKASYSALVFRMAVFSAYGQARDRVIMDPAIAEEFPWIFYDAINDDRVRPDHFEMDGKVWRRDEFPAEWTPPNGYNCRCEKRAMTDEMAKELGATEGLSSVTVTPDKGFRADQTQIATAVRARLREETGKLGG